jgi:predicted outer membrane protein
MLRYTFAAAALLAATSVAAQQPASPQTGSSSRPAQTTQSPNQSQGARNTANPAAQNNQAAPRNQVPDQAGQANRQAGRRGRQGETAGNRFDSHVADCLILGNQEEIALLKFGMERTKSDQVKELAQSMIKDHEKAISELREFASPQHANVELTADESSGRDVASTREARKVPAEADNAPAQGGQNNLLSKMHRMAKRSHEQCLTLSREELSKYKGHEFDQAFLGQQLGAHIGMLAKLKAAQEETSGELSSWTGKAQETTKKHKDHLEKLMNDLAKDAHSKK